MFKPLPNAVRIEGGKRAVQSAPVDRLLSIAGPRPLRILDFDIENRPLSYWYDGQCTAEVTAIAWAWINPSNGAPLGTVYSDTLFHDRPLDGPRLSAIAMLQRFKGAYDAADMVTGHYIRKHDLPIIQAALVEHDLPLLGPKLTSDTRLDLIKFKDLAKSQAALAAMLGIKAPKEAMTQSDWREANRLTVPGVRETMRRVVGDVEQHIDLRVALIDRDLLKPPRLWRG